MTIGTHNLFEDYNPKDEVKINEAVEVIKCNLLTKSTNIELDENTLNHTFSVSSLAIKYFNDLSSETQTALEGVYNMLFEILLDEEYQQSLSRNSKAKEIQNKLVQIFYLKFNQQNIAKKARVEEEEWNFISDNKVTYTFENDNHVSNQKVVTDPTHKFYIPPASSNTPLKLDLKARKELANKAKQIEIVSDFARRFMRDYYPLIIQGKESSPEDKFLQFALKRFMETFPSALPHFLFKEPKILGVHEKVILVGIMNQLNNFFKCYNSAVITIKETNRVFDQLDQLTKETLILDKIKSLSVNENQLSLVPQDLDEAEFTIQLTKTLEKVILKYFEFTDPDGENKPKEVQEFTATMISLLAIPICCHQVLSPLLFCLLFDNLLLRDIDISSDYITTPPLSSCDCSDEVFSKRVGALAENLVAEVLLFGEAQGVIKSAKFFIKKDKIGAIIQKGINQILGTDTSLKPILILDNLLYHNGQPTLKGAFNNSPDKNESYRKEIELKVRTRIYDILKEKLPKVVVWATDKLTSLDTFCETMSRRLFELTQSKKLYMLLACYLLQGVYDGFSELCNEQRSKKNG